MQSLFFHISEVPLNDHILYPRIPRRVIRDIMFGFVLEDQTIPRVCFSKTLQGALMAASPPPMRDLYIHVPVDYEGTVWDNQIVQRHVADAYYTGEVWLLEPVKIKVVGEVIVQREQTRRVALPFYYYLAHTDLPRNTQFWIIDCIDYVVTAIYDERFKKYAMQLERKHVADKLISVLRKGAKRL